MSNATLRYDDAIVRRFVTATIVWGAVGMLVGLWCALQLALPSLNFAPYFTFGRLRPLHTNAVIFAFAGNVIFAGIYYSTQRLLKARMCIDLLSQHPLLGLAGDHRRRRDHAAARASRRRKEYAELEWPIDIAIAVVWVAFAVNFFGTLARDRREKHLYVAIWFYIATIITVAMLHIFNNLVDPGRRCSRATRSTRGVQDAFMQWWYGHNAVAFFLTTPFLGLMYYFLPKAAERPVFSYRLSILHFWSLVFIYIWAGPHHLLYTALPEWASTLGMVFSVMLWMPSWGGMINGLLTLRGAWDKVAEDPVLKFFVVGITFYGMATFEGPLLSIKSVNALVALHRLDHRPRPRRRARLERLHGVRHDLLAGAAPVPDARSTRRSSPTTHFWIGTFGILLYVVAMWAAGITQGLMWRAFDETGRLQYPDFVETVTRLMPMYWMRALGGSLYIAGLLHRRVQHLHDVADAPGDVRGASRSTRAADRSREAKAAERETRALETGGRRTGALAPHVGAACRRSFTVLVARRGDRRVAVRDPADVPDRRQRPDDRDGQAVHAARARTAATSTSARVATTATRRWSGRSSTRRCATAERSAGEYSQPGEFVYDHPFQWGSKRTGPDLAREGGQSRRALAPAPPREPARDVAGLDHAELSAPARRRHSVERHPVARRRDGDARRAVRRGRARRTRHASRATRRTSLAAQAARRKAARPDGEQGGDRADRVPAAARRRHPQLEARRR